MPKNNRSSRGQSKNNNPEGYNQFTSGWMDTARERPVAAAAAAAAAVGASVFLWSRRSQISEQLSNLSDQIGEWSETMNARGGSDEFEMAGGGQGSFSGSSAGGSPGGEFSGSGTPPASGFSSSPTGGPSDPNYRGAKRGGGKSGGGKGGPSPSQGSRRI